MEQTKLVPFNLNKVKDGAKVVTRCGYPVRIGFYDIKGTSFPILGAVTEEENTEVVLSFTKDGCYTSLDVKNDYDLFIEEEEEETDYNPYKETVKSISDMVERYSELQSLEDLQDFYDNVKVKCREVVEYDKKWCKKQEEQKTSDSLKIMPDKWYTCIKSWATVNMKIGDWFEEGHYYLGSDILKYKGLLEDDEDFKDYFHLWNISDAKDGDVLAVNNEVFIYAHKKQMYPIVVAHCFVNCAGGFYLDGEFGYQEYTEISPATKEQSNLLFQKMKEAGYKWDSDKKELKKIEEVKKRRMTNQELSWWLRDCPEEYREVCRVDEDTVYCRYIYLKCDANDEVPEYVRIRRNGGEWQEPLIEE